MDNDLRFDLKIHNFQHPADASAVTIDDVKTAINQMLLYKYGFRAEIVVDEKSRPPIMNFVSDKDFG